VALDLDGTILDMKLNLDPRDVEALGRIVSAGVTVIACTGRPFPGAVPWVKRLGLDGPIVCYQGAEVRTLDGGVLLERLVFRPLRDAPEVNAVIAAVGALFFLQALAQAAFGAEFRVLPTPYDHVVHVAGLIATQQQLEGVFDSAFIAAAYEFGQMGRADLTRIACMIAMVESEHRALGRDIARSKSVALDAAMVGTVSTDPADNWAFAPQTISSVGAAPARTRPVPRRAVVPRPAPR